MTGVQTCALPICFPVTISRIGYKKSIEKKYNDRAIGAGFTQYGFGNAGTSTTANAITSVGFKSGSWYGFNFREAKELAVNQIL